MQNEEILVKITDTPSWSADWIIGTIGVPIILLVATIYFSYKIRKDDLKKKENDDKVKANVDNNRIVSEIYGASRMLDFQWGKYKKYFDEYARNVSFDESRRLGRANSTPMHQEEIERGKRRIDRFQDKSDTEQYLVNEIYNKLIYNSNILLGGYESELSNEIHRKVIVLQSHISVNSTSTDEVKVLCDSICEKSILLRGEIRKKN